MAKVRSVIKCVTSRQVCFPLIFTIAVISLAVSLVEFSGVNLPGWARHKFYQKPVDFSPRDSSELKMWKEWKASQIRRNFQEEKVQDKLMDLRYQNIDSFPKIKLPFAPINKKRVRKKFLGNTKTWKTTTSTNSPPSSRTTTINRQKSDEERLQRHEEQKVVEISENDVKNITVFDEALNDILYPEITETSNNTSNKIELLPEQTKGVLIVTNYRSGSTFLGQLFNQHPQAFYTFEPLYPFGWNCTSQVERRVQLLHNMFKCSFPDMKTLYKDINFDFKKLNDSETTVHSKCIEDNFCFRYNHKDLCSKDICPKGNSESCAHCGPADISLVNNKCRSRKISAIKVIKLCDIRSLESIVRDPSLDLKIIHLVRDPRGIASSRLKIHNDWEIVGNMASVCEHQATNARAGKDIDWLQGRYKLVRYEDIALSPTDTAKEIYDFVGLPFVDSVRSWIEQNTRMHKSKARDSVRAKRFSSLQEYDAAKDPYSTQRDSNAAMQAWRKHLSFDTISKIQKRCSEALRTMRYKNFKTENDLLNLNISAILST